MPAGETDAPGAIPAQDMLRFRLAPEGEIGRMTFLASDQLARFIVLLVYSTVGQLAVIGIAEHIEINIAIGDIGVAPVEQGFDHLDLLRHVTAGARRNIGPPHTQRVHILEIAARVSLNNLHRFGVELGGANENAIFFVGAQVPDISDVLHIEQVKAAITEVTRHHIK